MIITKIINWHKNARLSFKSNEIKRSLRLSFIYLFIIVLLHIFFMMKFELLSFGDSLWLTLTTISTTGYGDISAQTWYGKAATILLLYIGGIFTVGHFAGNYFDYRASNRANKIKGNWRWNMQDHLLIINEPKNNTETFFINLIKQFRESEIKNTVEIITQKYPEGLPDKLAQMPGVAHYNGNPLVSEDLNAVNPEKAKYIVILAKEEGNPDSDSRTFDILYRLNQLQLNPNILILAECVNDQNRKNFKDMGADIIIRPIRAYPEMLARGITAPGSEQIIENLFSARGDRYIRYEIKIKDIKWKEIVSKFIMNDLGTAIAYIDAETLQVITNPLANTKINCSSLLVMLDERSSIEIEENIYKILLD